VAAEAAGRIDAVGDAADDRMCVRGHVVEAGPGLRDRRAGRRRVAAGEPREPVGEERFVDGCLERPARLRIGHREHQPVAATAEVEAALGLDHHR